MQPQERVIYLRQRFQALFDYGEQSKTRLANLLPNEALPPAVKTKMEEYLSQLQDRVTQRQQQLLGPEAFALLEDIEHHLHLLQSDAQEQLNQVQRQDMASPYQGITGEVQRVLKGIFKRFQHLADKQAHPYISEQAAQDWHVHSSPLQQQHLVTDTAQQQLLSTILDQIAALHQQRKQQKVSCFLSYAWPSEKRLYESWVQPFLIQFAHHLRQAGLRVYLDVDDSRYGFNSYHHMQRILSSNFILLMGTESLVDKHRAGISNVCHELNLIREKRIQDQKHLDYSVIPLLLSGAMEDALPEEYQRYTAIESFVVGNPLSAVDKGYIGRLRELVAKMYGWSFEDRDYQVCWREAPADWFKPLTPEVVEAKLKQQPLAYAYTALTQATMAPVTHWEIPSANPHFVGRLSALEDIATALQEGSIGLISQAITGLGGVGKTQLANHYAHCALKRDVVAGRALEYDAVFWLRAQDLRASINKIAEKYQIDPLRYQGQEQELLREVYRALAKQYKNILLVLDDVESYENIARYLPGQYLQAGFQCHVLMTSRQQHWPSIAQIKQVALKDFTPVEAVEYILKSLPKETPASAEKLAELLHFFPLALAQAVAFSQEMQLSLPEYMEYYQQSETEQRELLTTLADVAPGQPEEDSRKRAVYLTWHISIEQMRRQNEALAEHVLNLSTYLAPQSIPLSLLSEILKCQSVPLKKALRVLRAYSLIEYNEGTQTIAIHQLLQEVIRLHLKAVKYQTTQPSPSCSLLPAVQIAEKLQGIPEASEHEVWLLTALDYLSTHFHYDKRDPQSWVKAKLLFPHAQHIANITLLAKLMLIRVADLFKWLGNFQSQIYSEGHKAIPCYRSALNIWEHHLNDSNSPEVARILNNLANAYEDLGDTKQAKELLDRSLKILEAHYGPKHIEVVKVLVSLANAVGALGDSNQAKALLERALEIRMVYSSTEDNEVADILNSLAHTVGELGDIEQKKILMELALKIEEAYFGSDHFEVAKFLVNYANAVGALGDTKQKKALLERALKIGEAHYGSEHVEIANVLVNYANAVGALGDTKQKKALLERALKIEEAHYGPEHVEVASTLENLAAAVSALGYAQDAKALLERALKTMEKYYGPEHVEVAKTLGNLAAAFVALGHAQDAKALLERALMIKEANYGAEHIEVASALVNLASAVGALGDNKKKKVLLERAIKIEEAHYGSDHPEVALTLNNYAQVFLSEGNLQRALSLLERAYKNFLKAPGYGASHPQAVSIEKSIQKIRRLMGKVSASKASGSASAVSESSKNTSSLLQQSNQQGIEHFKAKRYLEAITVFQAAFSQALPSHPDPEGEAILASIHNNLAAAYRESKQYEKAVGHFAKCLAYHEKVLGNRSEAYQKASQKKAACEAKLQSLALNKEGVAHFKAGRFNEALGCFKKVLKTNREFYREAHEDTATAAFNVGSCYWRLEHFDEAIPYLQQVFDMRLKVLGESHTDTQKAKQRLEDCQQKLAEQQAPQRLKP